MIREDSAFGSPGSNPATDDVAKQKLGKGGKARRLGIPIREFQPIDEFERRVAIARNRLEDLLRHIAPNSPTLQAHAHDGLIRKRQLEGIRCHSEVVTQTPESKRFGKQSFELDPGAPGLIEFAGNQMSLHRCRADAESLPELLHQATDRKHDAGSPSALIKFASGFAAHA